LYLLTYLFHQPQISCSQAVGIFARSKIQCNVAGVESSIERNQGTKVPDTPPAVCTYPLELTFHNDVTKHRTVRTAPLLLLLIQCKISLYLGPVRTVQLVRCFVTPHFTTSKQNAYRLVLKRYKFSWRYFYCIAHLALY